MKDRSEVFVDPLQFEMSNRPRTYQAMYPYWLQMGPPSDKQREALEKLGIYRTKLNVP
jgi:hypothetical protein